MARNFYSANSFTTPYFIIIDGVLTKCTISRVISRYSEDGCLMPNATDVYAKKPDGTEARVRLREHGANLVFDAYYKEADFASRCKPATIPLCTGKIGSENLYVWNDDSVFPTLMDTAFEIGDIEFIESSHGELKTNFQHYGHKDKFLFYNGYSVNETGEVIKRPSWKETLAFTPEQQEIIDNIKKLYDDAINAGIGFVFSDRTQFAINTKNLRDYDNEDLTTEISVDLLDKVHTFYDYDNIPGYHDKWADDEVLRIYLAR